MCFTGDFPFLKFLNSHYRPQSKYFSPSREPAQTLLIDFWMLLDKAAREWLPPLTLFKIGEFEKAARNSKQELTALCTLCCNPSNQIDLTPSTVLLVLLLIS